MRRDRATRADRALDLIERWGTPALFLLLAFVLVRFVLVVGAAVAS